MIKKIFILISRRLNTKIKFINIRNLKRKKSITVIDLLYLVFSKFQINSLLSNIIDTIKTIYNILYNTILSIYNLFFGKLNKEEQNIPEPYDYYVDKKYNIGQEESYSWYQDYYLIGGTTILLFLLIYGYKKWDSDSTIKDNILEMGSSLILIMKSIKDALTNNSNNRQEEEENGSEESSERSINMGINPENVDVRIICDTYKYRLFKNYHDLNNWPEFNSDEHNSMITKLNNTESRKIYHTYETMENLIEKYLFTKEIIKSATPEELNVLEKKSDIIRLHKCFTKTNEETKNILNKSELEKDFTRENDDWIRNRSYDLSNINNSPQSTTSSLEYETPKASTSQLPPAGSIFPEWNLAKDSSFNKNLKGKFKSDNSIFDSDKSYFDRFRENINDQSEKLKEVLSNTSVSNIITTTSDLINEESALENITEFTNDNKSEGGAKNDKPDIKTYKLDPNSTERPYHIHFENPNELCNKEHPTMSEAKKELMRNPQKSYSLKSIFNVISGQSNEKIQLNTVSDDELNLYSKTTVDQDKLDKLTRGKVIEDEVRYINPKNLVRMSDLDAKSKNLQSKTPLEVKLSKQLDKIKMNEIPDDEIKRAPTWED
jgi:hypothetical protein